MTGRILLGLLLMVRVQLGKPTGKHRYSWWANGLQRHRINHTHRVITRLRNKWDPDEFLTRWAHALNAEWGALCN